MADKNRNRFDSLFFDDEEDIQREFEETEAILELAEADFLPHTKTATPPQTPPDYGRDELLVLLEPQRITPASIERVFRDALSVWAKQNDDVPNNIASKAVITNARSMTAFTYTTRSLALRHLVRKDYAPIAKGTRLSPLNAPIESYLPSFKEPEHFKAMESEWLSIPVTEVAECVQCKGSDRRCISCGGSNRCRISYEVQTSFTPEIHSDLLAAPICPSELVGKAFGERVMKLTIFHALNDVVIKSGDLKEKFSPLAERIRALIPQAGKEVQQRFQKLRASGHTLWRIDLDVMRIPVHHIVFTIGNERSDAWLYGIDNLIHCRWLPVDAFSSFTHFIVYRLQSLLTPNAANRGVEAIICLCRELALVDGAADEREWRKLIESFGKSGSAEWCERASLEELYDAIRKSGFQSQCIAALQRVAAADGTICAREERFIKKVRQGLGIR